MVTSTTEEVFFPAEQEWQQGRGCAAQGTSGAEAELCCLGRDESGAKVKWVLFELSVGRKDSASYSEVGTRSLV